MDVEDSEHPDFFKNPERYLNRIQDESKIVRRDAMKTIYSEVKLAMGEDKSSVPLERTEVLLRPITLLIRDPMEKTRELAYELLGIFIRNLPKTKLKEILPTLIPILVERLGQPELNEPSEEIRLLAVKRLQDLLKHLGTDLNPFIDDILQVLASTITDPFHSVRILSCEFTSKLADVCRTVFHYNSERLLRPLCSSVSHQQLRVRCAVVACMGQVVLLGNHKGIETILPHITQRVFDPSPGVRLAVVTAVGDWMLNFIDRYSYFYKLLPIMMALQQDESDVVTKEARLRWNAIGEKYLAENIEQYRDQVDFPIPQPTHYPKDVQRANLGCRLLSWQCVYNILPALAEETSDWVANTRIKSTLLLYYLILNCEDKITMHVEKIFPIIYKTIRDEEAEVVAHTEKAANAIGYFVPLSVTWSILSSAVSMGANEGNLSVLKSVLEGTEPGILIDFVEEVLKLLGDADVVESRNKKRQAAILSICDSLLNLAPEKVAEEGLAANFFRIVITTWAQASDVEIALRGSSILENLGHVLDMDLNSVMGKFSGEILTAIANKDSEWTSVSTDKLIFDVILSQGGLAVDNNMDTLLKIMLSNLNPEKDPEVRLKFLTTLAKHLEVYCSGASVDNESLQTFVKRIIEEVLDPNLIWKAGKTAGVLRTAAVSCLLAVLGARILDAGVLSGMAPKMVTSLTEVIEDASETTRVLSCECLRKLVTEAKGGLPPDVLNKLYPVILKRLDDVSNTVRISALNTISAIFTNLPSEYDLDRYHVYVEHVYTALILHLDDSDGEIQDKVQSVLASIGHLSPNSLITECEKTKMKHRSPLRCDALIEKFNDLRVSAQNALNSNN